MTVLRLHDGTLDTAHRSGASSSDVLSPGTIDKLNAYGNADSNVSNPVISADNLSWDTGLREPGSVLFDSANGVYYAYHTGSDNGDIGVFESSDGYSWTETANSPMLDSITGSYQDAYVIPPWKHSADSSTWYMFVERNSDNTTVRFEGNGPDSIESNETLIVDNGATGTWEENNAASPIVFEDSGTWYCLYEGLDANNDHGQLGLATASGVDAAGTWSKSADNPIVPYVSGTWRDNVVVGDEILLQDDGRYVLTCHGRNANSNYVDGVLYTDVPPEDWTDGGDWSDPNNGDKVEWLGHDDSGGGVSAMIWEHQETGEINALIGKSDTSDVYQERALHSMESVYRLPLDHSPDLAYYPTTAGSGNTLYEESGDLGVNGSLRNSPTWNRDSYGQHLSFNSANSQDADLGAQVFSGLSACTLMLWVRGSGSKAAIASENNVFAIQERNSDGDWRALIGDGGAWGSTATEAFNLGDSSLHFIAARFDGGTDLSLWRDGGEVASSAPTETSLGNNDQNPMIANWSPTASAYWDGDLYWGRAVNKYLSNAQLKTIYEKTNPEVRN